MIGSWEIAAFGVGGILLLAVAVRMGPLRRDAGNRRFRPAGLVLPVAVGAILLAGWLAGAWRAGFADADVRGGLARQAHAVAQAINPDLVRRLSFTIDDRGNPAFERLRSQ